MVETKEIIKIKNGTITTDSNRMITQFDNGVLIRIWLKKMKDTSAVVGSSFQERYYSCTVIKDTSEFWPSIDAYADYGEFEQLTYAAISALIEFAWWFIKSPLYSDLNTLSKDEYITKHLGADQFYYTEIEREKQYKSAIEVYNKEIIVIKRGGEILKSASFRMI